MPAKASDADFDHAVKDYVSGSTGAQAARRWHVGADRLYNALRVSGLLRPDSDRQARAVVARRANRGLPDDEIVAAYREGVSELALARRYETSRTVIRTRLRAAGITPRGPGEANRLRFADPTQRGLVTRKAHLSMGRGETDLLAFLRERGVHAARQVVIEQYNVDLAIGPVAVEVHARPVHPLSPNRSNREARRIEQLCRLGWSVEYVWITARSPLTIEAADDCIAFAHSASLSPAGVGEYRVIRGSGELVAFGRPDGDQVTLIPPPERRP